MNWRNIKKLKFLGIEYQVKWVNTLKEIHPKKKKLASIDPNKKILKIYNKIPDIDSIRSIFIHEMQHLILMHLNRYDQKEGEVSLMADLWYAFLKDNDMLNI